MELVELSGADVTCYGQFRVSARENEVPPVAQILAQVRRLVLDQ